MVKINMVRANRVRIEWTPESMTPPDADKWLSEAAGAFPPPGVGKIELQWEAPSWHVRLAAAPIGRRGHEPGPKWGDRKDEVRAALRKAGRPVA